MEKSNLTYTPPFGILEWLKSAGDAGLARWEKWIDRSYHPQGCWLFTGAPNRGSGGETIHSYRFHMTIGDKIYKPSAPRVAWSLHHNAEFPSHLLACHTCDNRQCVNWEHIWVGTNKQNLEDCSRKGRKLKYPLPLRLECAKLFLDGVTTHQIKKRLKIKPYTLLNILRDKNMIRKYGMTVFEYKEKLIKEHGTVPKNHEPEQYSQPVRRSTVSHTVQSKNKKLIKRSRVLPTVKP